MHWLLECKKGVEFLNRKNRIIRHIARRHKKNYPIFILILDKMPGGVFHFEIADILRNAVLISSTLSNSETWYGLTQLEKYQLEQIDEMLLRFFSSCFRNVPKDWLYLKMGLMPISYIMNERRLLFLHHILRQKEDFLVFRFFMAQFNSPTNNDWVSTVLEV